MSNGLTAVFIATIVIAASSQAVSSTQKRITIWLASRDQAMLGLGTVGFDIAELPWDLATFVEDRGFLAHSVDRASNQFGWEVLGYTPDAEVLFSKLQQFRRLLEHLKVADLSPAQYDDVDEFIKCPTHNAYLHRGGCVICNDASGCPAGC